MRDLNHEETVKMMEAALAKCSLFAEFLGENRGHYRPHPSQKKT
jgi:hypothetical protein